jgi:hypothetical protein
LARIPSPSVPFGADVIDLADVGMIESRGRSGSRNLGRRAGRAACRGMSLCGADGGQPGTLSAAVDRRFHGVAIEPARHGVDR